MAMRKLFNGKKRKLDGVDGNVTKSFKMFKIKSLKKKQLFCTSALFFLACPLLGGYFHRKNPNRT